MLSAVTSLKALPWPWHLSAILVIGTLILLLWPVSWPSVAEISLPSEGPVVRQMDLQARLATGDGYAERPLFAPITEDLTDDTTKPVISRPRSRPNVKLLGITEHQGKRAALLQISGTKPELFQIGQSVQEWRIEAITLETLTLLHGEESWSLQLGQAQ